MRTLALLVATLSLVASAWAQPAKTTPAPAPTAAAPITTARMALAVELIDISGVAAQIRSALQLMLPTMSTTLRAQAPQLTDADLARFSGFFLEEMDARMPAITNDLAAEYARRFNEAELRDMIGFYRTPAGARLIRETPALQAASAEVGRRYGAEAGMRAAVRLRAPVNTP